MEHNTAALVTVYAVRAANDLIRSICGFSVVLTSFCVSPNSDLCRKTVRRSDLKSGVFFQLLLSTSLLSLIENRSTRHATVSG